MQSIEPALIELERLDWSKYRDIRAFIENPVISSGYIPDTITAFFQAKSDEEIEEHYWHIENHVVVQGNTLEVAEHLMPVLMASLTGHEFSNVRLRVLELIFQMVAYSPHQGEIELGNYELTDRCRSRAREGLWDLYRILLSGRAGESDAAREVLEIVETDPKRLEAFIEARKALSNSEVSS